MSTNAAIFYKKVVSDWIKNGYTMSCYYINGGAPFRPGDRDFVFQSAQVEGNKITLIFDDYTISLHNPDVSTIKWDGMTLIVWSDADPTSADQARVHHEMC
eukprot:c919_g1_i1.p2 GENE.c919_g1_i1~~c919_g1_i1.p2  ORF type:complete len:115 (-),score=26.81 c919_g1_i1:46-348(-)